MDEHNRCDGARFYLSTLRLSVSSAALLSDSRLCMLAAEDAAWCAAEEHWKHRAPRRWQWRKRRRWNAECKTLLAARSQLHDLARTLGLPVEMGH